jgi:acyl carrier protein
MREQVYERLNKVFREMFDDDTITLNDKTTAKDVDGWDSLTYMSLIMEIESEFDMKFSVKDIISMQSVGEMVDIIMEQAHL